MKKLTKIFSLILALLMLSGLMSGCSAEDLGEALQTAADVVEIIQDIEAAEPGEESEETGEEPGDNNSEEAAPEKSAAIDENGSYTSKEDVALYLHTYGRLPDNFVTKDEARKAGWEGGSLEPYLPGMCIGGDRFGNREGLLPDEKGRSWTECDIDTLGAKSRGAKRIVFSNDGLIYYTGDHYESFELLYSQP